MNVDDVARALDELVLQRLRARSGPGAWISMLMPWSSSVFCRSASDSFASSTSRGMSSWNAAHLLGDRVGQQEAADAQRREQPEVDERHRQAARQAGALHDRHHGVQDERDDARRR